MPIGSGLSSQVGWAEETYVNEVQRISGTPSATFGLTFDGANTTVTLSTTASAASVQAALEALPNIGTGGVTASGGPLPTQIDVTFSGPLVGKRNVPQLTVQPPVTGLTITTVTAGKGYGDYVAPTRFLEFNSEGLAVDVDRIESQAIRAGGMVQRSDRWGITRKGGGGPLELECVNKGMGLLFAHMMGKAAVITTPTGGTNSRLHTHTLGDAWNRSISYQKGVPTVIGEPSNVKPFSFTGGKVTQGEFNVSVDAFLRLTLTMDVFDVDTTQTLGAASYATGLEQFHYQQAQIQMQGAFVEARSWNFTIPRPLATDRRFLRSDTRKKEPILNALTNLTGTIELEFDSMVNFNRFNSATPAGAVIPIIVTITAPIIESSLPFFIRFTTPAARIDGATPTISGPDLVVVSYPYRVLFATVNEPLTLEYQTTDTAS